MAEGADNFVTVKVQDPDGNKSGSFRFASNLVVTSHYTLLNFFPKNMFEQFHNVANWYFVYITIFQMIPAVSITGGLPTMLPPLMFVLVVAAIKDGIEDVERHKADNLENNRKVLVKTGGSGSNTVWSSKKWREVVVGDVVKIENGDNICSDIVLTNTSIANGLCYVMTANLDGETNLKVKESHKDIAEDSILEKGSVITCDLPNKYLERFTGTFIKANKEKVPLAPRNVMLRGTQMKNTEWAIGVVVYTGKQAKISMNAAPPPTKGSTLMKKVGKFTAVAFFTDFCLCIIASITSAVYNAQDMVINSDYLGTYEDGNLGAGPVAGALFVILFNYQLIFAVYIPISLLVSFTMIQGAQKIMIDRDLDIYYAETDTPTKVRCSALNEELGMVGHVFSDKTGTLTCNVMDFRKCTINGVQYGQGLTEIARAVMRAKGLTPPADPVADPNEPTTKMVNFIDPAMKKLLNSPKHPDYKKAHEFYVGLALNHTVMPEKAKDGDITYSASSPDEAALVYGARHFGYFFKARTPETITVLESGGEVTYKLLHTIEFTSTRKRSSVIIQRADGSYVLFCKGADNVIKQRLEKSTPKAVIDATMSDLGQYSEDGLRALLIVKRELDKDFYLDWARKYHDAETSMADRDKLMEEVSEEVECDLELLGITAIEDMLQKGVPSAINSLLEAGMKVWMLTGDRVSTAINIGFACSLLTPTQTQLRLVGDDMDPSMVDPKTNVPTKAATIKALDDMVKTLAGAPPGSDVTYAFVVDTYGLEAVLEFNLGMKFLQVCSQCRSVICARVSPDQKGQVVLAVREANPNIITLAIGDGANDCNMIQRAHIGVGISGLEGLQAVNASDFAIAQFRFLVKLLLVHGRWNMYRSGRIAVYMFYKVTIFCFPQFFLGFAAVMSGQNYYHDGIYQMYNMICTGLPPVVFASLAQDVKAEVVLEFPALYCEGKKGVYVSWKHFLWGTVMGITQGLIIFLCSAFAFGDMVDPSSGRDWSIWDVGAWVNFCVVTVSLLVLLIDYRHWTGMWGIAPFFVISIAGWFLTLGVTSTQGMYPYWQQIADTVTVVLAQPASWVLMPPTVMLCISMHLVPVAWQWLFNPTGSQLCMEYQQKVINAKAAQK